MYNVMVNGHIINGVVADSADEALLKVIQFLGLDVGFDISAQYNEM